MFSNIKRRLSKVIKKNDNSQSIITRREHTGIPCDSCNKRTIIGDRFACTQCPNYNLCSECFCTRLKSKRHELDHPCLLVIHPNDNRTIKLDNLVQEYKTKDFNMTCDLCDTKIYGVYVKCNVCYCTFMCLECAKDHDKTHPQILYNTVRIEKFDFEDLKLDHMLDNGNFGFVYEGVLKPYKYHVACKLMNKKIFNKISFKRFDFTPKETNMQEKFLCVDKELEAYIEIFSPFIVKLLGYGRDNTQRLFLVMEFMSNGSLEDFIMKNSQVIPLYLKLKIMLNIASGLVDIHAKNFIHADIKPKNILLDSNYTAKICDLGSMKNLNFNTYDNNTGGLYYLPMEFFMGKYDNRIDIYSFGLIMYHLFSGFRHSYTGQNQLVINKLSKIQFGFLKSMILKATHGNPNERKTILYYKNILHMYIMLLEECLEKFSLENIPQLDLIIMCLNDSILKYINLNYDVNLDLNDTNVSLESIMDDKVKKNVIKSIEYLNQINSVKRDVVKNIEMVNKTNFFLK